MENNEYGMVPPTNNGPMSLKHMWGQEFVHETNLAEPVRVDEAVSSPVNQSDALSHQLDHATEEPVMSDVDSAFHNSNHFSKEAKLGRDEIQNQGTALTGLNLLPQPTFNGTSAENPIQTDQRNSQSLTSQPRPSEYTGMTRIPENLQGFVPEEYVEEINGIQFVDSKLDSILKEAEEARNVFERDYTPEEVDMQDEELILYLGNETWQDESGRKIYYASKKAIKEAKAQIERDNIILNTVIAEHEIHVEHARYDAENSVLEMLEEFGTFGLVKDLLDDQIYQHPAAEILNSAYRGAIAVILENETNGNDEAVSFGIAKKFVDSHTELINRTREEDKITLQLKGFDPEEFYIEKTDEQMRLHRDVVGDYVHFLLSQAQTKFFNEEYNNLVVKAETPPQPVSQNGFISRWLSKVIDTSGVEELKLPKTPAEVLLKKIANIEETESRQDEAMRLANVRLRMLLAEKATLLGSDGKVAALDYENPENNPLLLVTDKKQVYINLMDFSEVPQIFRGYDIAGDGETTLGFLLKGFADKHRTDDIDRLSARMGDTKGPIARKIVKVPKAESNQLALLIEGQQYELDAYEESDEEAVAHVGIVSRKQGDRPLSGGFLVEVWPHAYKPVFSHEPGEPDRAVRLHVFQLTDAMEKFVSDEYISFYAPGGRAAHGNLDAKIFDDLHTYTQLGLRPAVNKFRDGIEESRRASANAYVVPEFVTPAAQLLMPPDPETVTQQTPPPVRMSEALPPNSKKNAIDI